MTVRVEEPRDPARRTWWPIAALAVVLVALGATIVTTAGLSPLGPAPKAAYLDALPRLDALDSVTAPTPSASPDPATYIQQINIILPLPPPPPASTSGTALNKGDAGAFCAAINAERQNAGLSALGSCYATATRQKHANSMAATNPPSIWHQGDNIVGVAPSLSRLMAAFMASPGHHDQILTGSYTGAKVGCAWGQPAGYSAHLYCTADFF